jgi:hypothetical protein
MEGYSGKQFVGIDLGGGPFNRAAGTDPHPDFLFPQMVSPEMGPEHWEPRYLDYLDTGFTNVMAFSPTDTMPLSRGRSH